MKKDNRIAGKGKPQTRKSLHYKIVVTLSRQLRWPSFVAIIQTINYNYTSGNGKTRNVLREFEKCRQLRYNLEGKSADSVCTFELVV